MLPITIKVTDKNVKTITFIFVFLVIHMPFTFYSGLKEIIVKSWLLIVYVCMIMVQKLNK